MLYRLRVYGRYWRRSFSRFNADVRDVSWGRLCENCFFLGLIAVLVRHAPFPLAQHIFEQVVWVAVQYAMVGWLILIPFSLGYALVVKTIGGRQ